MKGENSFFLNLAWLSFQLQWAYYSQSLKFVYLIYKNIDICFCLHTVQSNTVSTSNILHFICWEKSYVLDSESKHYPQNKTV